MQSEARLAITAGGTVIFTLWSAVHSFIAGILIPIILIFTNNPPATWISWIMLVASGLIIVGMIGLANLQRTTSKSFAKLLLWMAVTMVPFLVAYYMFLFVELPLSTNLFATLLLIVSIIQGTMLRIHTKQVQNQINTEVETNVTKILESNREDSADDRIDQDEINKQIQAEIQEIYANNSPEEAERLLKEKQEEWAKRR